MKVVVSQELVSLLLHIAGAVSSFFCLQSCRRVSLGIRDGEIESAAYALQGIHTETVHKYLCGLRWQIFGQEKF